VCYNGKYSLFLQKNTATMEKILPIHLQEIYFSSSDKKESKLLSKLLKENKIRKIASKIYTSNLTDLPENIIKRNLFIILGRLYPKATLSHRTAFEFAPTKTGHIYLTYIYSKKISLPGITIHLIEGKSALPDDNLFVEGLHASQRERAFLENLQISRKSGDDSKTLSKEQIEDKLEQYIRINGEDAVNKLRDKAREISLELEMPEEFEHLNKMIGALLTSKPVNFLSSPLAIARAFGFPYDSSRLELFNMLYSSLMKEDFPSYKDLNTTEISFRNFAFYESYFSNYIEGTRFEVEEALSIIENNKPLPARNDDSHDVLGTFYLVSNRTEMNITPESPEDLIKILQYRHRIIMSARQNKFPGEFKDRNNYAGNTTFVDFNLVKGTLIKGFDYYDKLTMPFAKAIFIMFLISEVHPFLDGNGRIARIMMNAELVKSSESKIIIPNVFREDYLLVLRKLTRQSDPEPYIKAMKKLHKFSSGLYGEDWELMRNYLNNSNAFLDSSDGVLNFTCAPLQ